VVISGSNDRAILTRGLALSGFMEPNESDGSPYEVSASIFP
jgi:hypothetical protein